MAPDELLAFRVVTSNQSGCLTVAANHLVIWEMLWACVPVASMDFDCCSSIAFAPRNKAVKSVFAALLLAFSAFAGLNADTMMPGVPFQELGP